MYSLDVPRRLIGVHRTEAGLTRPHTIGEYRAVRVVGRFSGVIGSVGLLSVSDVCRPVISAHCSAR